ncbi:Endo-1,4-beta-xylanase A precursor [Enhygromyxa salina]|uniref:Endo-1,4-beta-xylanase A n=1 Tax=Enhygromyxa salina TaxID=215803 RepID=A0A0C2CNM6_9BACT|nr:hypothetical protein [Enhygromyxa salina]KIG12821.1 Endo-1,4-beta-xylanase A precursor [Enhygromyxa salina]
MRLGALGLLAGVVGACTITVGDGNWSDGVEECYDEYGDCMDDIDGPGDIAVCDALLDTCLEACDREHGYGDDGHDSGSSGSSGDSGDSGDGDTDEPDDGDGDPPPHDDDGGDGDGDGDGDGPDPACFEIHASCIDLAETIQDVEACNALFDNCVDPGPCESCEEPGCPQDQLDACVSGYANCAEQATTAEDVFVCEGMFDGCIGEFDVELCLPNYDDELVLACLGQHDLCAACADGPEELAACKTTFDNCLEG